MFSEQEFEEACAELNEPDTSDWEFFTESHSVKIYRQYNEESGLYSYKIYGTLDVLPEVCASVYMDYEYRREWDSYVDELYPVSEGDKKGLYWRVKFPFPLSYRDYCYIRELRQLDIHNKRVWVILARSYQFNSIPVRSGVVRVDDYVQSLALTEDNNGGTKAYMFYYDNPKGMIPTWLINWGAKTGVPGFLTQMQAACKNYEQFKQSLCT